MGFHPIHFPDEYFDVNKKKSQEGDLSLLCKPVNINRRKTQNEKKKKVEPIYREPHREIDS